MNRSIVVALCISALTLLATAPMAQEEVPLPHVREGGSPPDDPNQSLVPFAIEAALPDPGDLGVPTSGLLASPPEYGPSAGVMFRYTTAYGNIVPRCVGALTGDPAHDDIAYVVVSNATSKTQAENAFLAQGADLSKVKFLTHPSDSVWLRDYGPHFVWQDDALVIADSHYYPSRPLDNFIPTRVGEDNLFTPPYHMGLYYSGGNFQPGPGRSGFVTSLVNQDNPAYDNDKIAALYRDFQGIDTLHIMPRLPGSVDGTGHIDMWMYIVDEDDVIISEFKPGSNPTAIQVTENAVPYMQALGFTVHRTPAWNVGSTHYTYTNAFRVNDRIFTIKYGDGNSDYLDEDADADAAWKAAAGPGVEIIPIDCYAIIPAAGAIHCIVMQVPARTDPVPAAKLIAPDGGELIVAGTTEELIWAATDDVEVDSIDIDCSADGGATWPWIVATGERDDSRFEWTVPSWLSTNMLMRLVARDDVGNAVAVSSAATFEISDDPQHVYTFASGAGVDKWAWGDRSTTWLDVHLQQRPAAVSTPIETLVSGAYADISASDAAGGDSDTNRYISASPGSGKETTHVFEFTLAENRAALRDVKILWEGYGDQCHQTELYVWDYELGNWGDGAGLVGANNYATSYAGNRDDELVVHLQSDFKRWVDMDGTLSFMTYADRASQESFHDFVSVTTTYLDVPFGTWADLGLGLGGGAGVPVLEGTGLLSAGSTLSLQLENAASLAPATLVIGVSAAYLPFKGGTMVPSPDLLVTGLSTDAGGELALAGTLPGGLPAATPIVMQLWIQDGGAPVGWAASNGVSGTTP
ncbi:MAG: agmatine deiminase family protein [Planctomycetota bacterium]|jgi:agmatine/peptidylarginine deiminase